MIKGIIFDFNGTLFWDSEMHQQAWRGYSAKLRGYPFSDEEMQTHMFGRTNEDIITYAIGKKPDKKLVETLAAEKEAYYRNMCLNDPEHFILAPGVVEFLDYLKQNNIPMTIATMSEKCNVDFYIKEFKLAKWFDISKIVYSDGTIPGKPAPDIFQIAAKNLGLPPKECIVFEDAISGIEAAKRADIGEIIAITSMEKPEYYQSMDCVSKIIPDFKNILNIIEIERPVLKN